MRAGFAEKVLSGLPYGTVVTVRIAGENRHLIVDRIEVHDWGASMEAVFVVEKDDK